jgi:hypothetical protein
MPQLDLFSYTTLILSFGSFFFMFLLLGYVLFFLLAARASYCRLFFSVADLFQFIGGTRYMEGFAFFLLSREYTVYKFLGFVSQRM